MPPHLNPKHYRVVGYSIKLLNLVGYSSTRIFYTIWYRKELRRFLGPKVCYGRQCLPPAPHTNHYITRGLGSFEGAYKGYYKGYYKELLSGPK